MLRQTIETYPELGTALSKGGWEGYSTKAEEIRLMSQREFDNWVNNEAPPEIRDKYNNAGGGEKGYEAIKDDLNAMNKEYTEFQAKIASGEVIALPDGKYITKQGFDDLPKGIQEILKESGFEALPDYFVQDYFKDKGWDATLPSDKPVGYQKIGYGEMEIPIYSKEYVEYNERKAEAYRAYVAKFGGEGLMERGTAQVLGFIFPPAKAISPEFAIADVSKAEWALGGINIALIGIGFAPGAIMGSLAGKAIVTGLSTTGAGIIGYETAKSWQDLTPAQRAMGVGGAVLYALPLLTTVVRGVKITSTKIPTAEGEVVTWRGLSVAQRPILGKSSGQWVLGARNITLPEARLILNGYKPEMMLETKVFVNTKALKVQQV